MYVYYIMFTLFVHEVPSRRVVIHILFNVEMRLAEDVINFRTSNNERVFEAQFATILLVISVSISYKQLPKPLLKLVFLVQLYEDFSILLTVIFLYNGLSKRRLIFLEIFIVFF